VPPRDFSGEDVAKVLDRHGYQRVRQKGSHMIFKYRNEDTGELRTVSVPDHDRIRTGTLRKIMEQAGGKDFDAFCRWIDRNR
jgi:predicted RNA binding protein YcfA (HicA-like mRNA interferase family)